MTLVIWYQVLKSFYLIFILFIGIRKRCNISVFPSCITSSSNAVYVWSCHRCKYKNQWSVSVRNSPVIILKVNVYVCDKNVWLKDVNYFKIKGVFFKSSVNIF